MFIMLNSYYLEKTVILNDPGFEINAATKVVSTQSHGYLQTLYSALQIRKQDVIK